MESITYSQVQDLVQQLPPQYLVAAYEMLQDLSNHGELLQSQVELLNLSLGERQKILELQAEEMKDHYASSSRERADWQGGDFLDEGSSG